MSLATCLIKCKVSNTAPDLITDEKPQGTQYSSRSGFLLLAGVASVALGAFLMHKAWHTTWSSVRLPLNMLVYCTRYCYLSLQCFCLISGWFHFNFLVCRDSHSSSVECMLCDVFFCCPFMTNIGISILYTSPLAQTRRTHLTIIKHWVNWWSFPLILWSLVNDSAALL